MANKYKATSRLYFERIWLDLTKSYSDFEESEEILVSDAIT